MESAYYNRKKGAWAGAVRITYCKRNLSHSVIALASKCFFFFFLLCPDATIKMDRLDP